LPAAVAEPTRIRSDYVAIVQEFLSRAKAVCATARSDYVLTNTAEPVEHLLVRYLTARAKFGEARR
jgi:hypothetical protein